jgi:chloramphenicol 3-O phosphotransferase
MRPEGHIVILNGAPGSGKTSIVREIQEGPGAPWMNLGVDVFSRLVTPRQYQPGIGLRPGGERPDLEVLIPVWYRAMYKSVAAHSREGLNVVVDVGHHDGYSESLGVLAEAAEVLSGLPALLVGVRCPIEVVIRRRLKRIGNTEGPASAAWNDMAARAQLWEVVHHPGIYDLEVDTATMTPAACANAITTRLEDGPPPRVLATIARHDPPRDV